MFGNVVIPNAYELYTHIYIYINHSTRPLPKERDETDASTFNKQHFGFETLIPKEIGRHHIQSKIYTIFSQPCLCPSDPTLSLYLRKPSAFERNAHRMRIPAAL